MSGALGVPGRGIVGVDFVLLAKEYGMSWLQRQYPGELHDSLADALCVDVPILVHVAVKVK